MVFPLCQKDGIAVRKCRLEKKDEWRIAQNVFCKDKDHNV